MLLNGMSEHVTIARVSDFKPGKIRRYFLPGKEIAVVQWNGRFYAFSNRCTHNDFQLHFGYVEDARVCCPIHYAEFDIDTGRRKAGPMFIDDLPVYGVR